MASEAGQNRTKRIHDCDLIRPGIGHCQPTAGDERGRAYALTDLLGEGRDVSADFCVGDELPQESFLIGPDQTHSSLALTAAPRTAPFTGRNGVGYRFRVG